MDRGGMRTELLRWQWELYPDNHTRRLTIVVHVICVPLFIMALPMVALSLVFGWELAVAGVAFMFTAIAAEGWTHKHEPQKPIPFDGPVDFVARFVAEQLVTFPRFLMSGGASRVWRRARE
jgi:hypothetical protein